VTEHRQSAAVRTDRRSTSGKAFPGKDDPHARLTHAEFLARAWKLANDKARELGWILKTMRYSLYHMPDSCEMMEQARAFA